MGDECDVPAALPPRERDPMYIVHEAGLASRLIWTGMEKRKMLCSSGKLRL